MAWFGRVKRDVRDPWLAVPIALTLIAIAIIAREAAIFVRATADVARPRALARVQYQPPPSDTRPIAQASQLRPADHGRTRRAAVLVGVDNAPGTDPLPGSRADARTMREALLMYGFESRDIVMLLDRDATRARVLRALDELARASTDESITVVSFAAHSFRSGATATMRLWDGRISAGEIARHLGRLRGRVWSTFATCYAGAYAVPGAVGSNRIAVFSSSASAKSLQLGDAGSFTVLYIARYAMLDGEADTSVEAAFRYAREHIALADSRQRPSMDDRIDGELVLGDPPAPAPENVQAMDSEPVPGPEEPKATPRPSVSRRLTRIPQNALRLGSSAVLVRPSSTPQSIRLDVAAGAGTERSASGVIEIL